VLDARRIQISSLDVLHPGNGDGTISYTVDMKLQPIAILVALSVAIAAQAPPARVNPLLSRSLLPFQAPPFDRITDADYEPAIEEGIRQERAEIARIANNTAAPTFANTITMPIALRERLAMLNDRSVRAVESINTRPIPGVASFSACAHTS
jgi:hypothetical protein